MGGVRGSLPAAPLTLFIGEPLALVNCLAVKGGELGNT